MYSSISSHKLSERADGDEVHRSHDLHLGGQSDIQKPGGHTGACIAGRRCKLGLAALRWTCYTSLTLQVHPRADSQLAVY